MFQSKNKELDTPVKPEYDIIYFVIARLVRALQVFQLKNKELDCPNKHVLWLDQKIGE